ncbi:hypothetical protein OPT61_g6412 [Boeremia exigua]|uniref:Uncharacterized protein n=1 Tax=Boeremia exigua TaxID=749465 RepID=A0ACC2I6Q8_9PLEO|nr:hypothetical protein OPT61_g6412 [Boeremia exigua]
MHRDRSKLRSNCIASSNDDSEYQTDGTSVDESIAERSRSTFELLSDEDLSKDKPGRRPEFYLAHAKEVNNAPLKSTHAESTMTQMKNVESDWRQYCDWMKKRPLELLGNISVGDVSAFFTWRLDPQRETSRQNPRSRRSCGIKAASSLNTYRKMFIGMYRILMKKDMDSMLAARIRKVAENLALTHGLSHTPREKPAIDAEDVLEIARTALTTVEKMFRIGRYRIQTCFFFQGGFITANRPDALLKLRYKDIKVLLLQRPSGGPHTVVLEWTYEFTKSHLGPKPANTFVIPEIIFDPSLVLSPHVFLLGLMFADKVFSIPNLTPERLYKLDIRPGCNSLEIPIKREMAELCVFRQCEQAATRCKIGNNGLSYAVLKAHMKDIGEIAGFKEITKPYNLRYGSGNAFDSNGDTSQDLRNLIMKHANTDVFLNHYLSRRITIDTQAIVRGLAPQSEMMRAACRMSRNIDPKRPRHLTREQSESVNNDPQVRKLTRQLEKSKASLAGKSNPEDLHRKLRNERQKLRYGLRNQIRKEYDRKQAEQDIQQQLSGEVFEQKMIAEAAGDTGRTPEHVALIEAIMSLPETSLSEEVHRRVKAIEAVSQYCKLEEGMTSRSRRLRYQDDGDGQTITNTYDKDLESARNELCTHKRPRICFLCLGNEQLDIRLRTYRFYTPGDLSKHFKKKHLAQLRKGESVRCRLCSVDCEDQTSLQRHAFDAHGTVSHNVN